MALTEYTINSKSAGKVKVYENPEIKEAPTYYFDGEENFRANLPGRYPTMYEDIWSATMIVADIEQEERARALGFKRIIRSAIFFPNVAESGDVEDLWTLSNNPHVVINSIYGREPLRRGPITEANKNKIIYNVTTTNSQGQGVFTSYTAYYNNDVKHWISLRWEIFYQYDSSRDLYVYSVSRSSGRDDTLGYPSADFCRDFVGMGKEASTDPYDPGGVDDGSPTGGDGDFDDTSDEIPYPIDFPNFTLTRGFMRIWQPTSEQLSQVAEWLWTSDFVDVVKKMFGNPIESIFSVHALPTPNVPSLNTPFRLGNVDAGFSVNFASQGYTTIDCGSIDLKRYWGSALDYSPFTKISLYLPYVGVVQLNTDEVMQKSIRIRYKIDLATGNFLALITLNGDVYYHFNGSCKYQFPVSGVNYSQIITNALSSIATAAGAVAATAATGGLTAPIAASAVGQIASNTVNSKATVQRSGSLSDMSGWFDVQFPYLIIERSQQSLPAYNNKFEGYPANANVTLGDMKGFTQVRLIHLENIPATENEIAEIERLLKEGVLM